MIKCINLIIIHRSFSFLPCLLFLPRLLFFLLRVVERLDDNLSLGHVGQVTLQTDLEVIKCALAGDLALEFPQE